MLSSKIHISYILYGILIITILIIFLIVISPKIHRESFTDLQIDYTRFYNFYTTFYNQWNKALISAVSANISQEPLKSPSDITSATSPQPSIVDLEQYVEQLKQTTSKIYPSVTPIPFSPTPINLRVIDQNLPTDPTPYKNAMEWMSENLQKSQATLQSSLAKMKEGFKSPLNPHASKQLKEAFEGAQTACQKIQECVSSGIANGTIILPQQPQQEPITPEQQATLETDISNKLQVFLTPDLLNQSTTVTQQFQQADKVKEEAQNGSLTGTSDGDIQENIASKQLAVKSVQPIQMNSSVSPNTASLIKPFVSIANLTNQINATF